MLKYCLYRYDTQEMCDKDVDACLPGLKIVPNWFVTKKMLDDLDNVVFYNDNLVFLTEDLRMSNILMMIWDLIIYIYIYIYIFIY